MARISARNKGQEDGGYSRIFGHSQPGASISQVQAKSIAGGNELGALVAKRVVTMSHDDLARFLSGGLSTGRHVLTKQMIKRHLKAIIGTTKEPDFVVFIPQERKVYAIELKDRDRFDTKKAAGEVANIEEFARALHGYLLGKLLDHVVEFRFCFFNQNDRHTVVDGMKREISVAQAMTGADFCRLIGADYEAIATERRADAASNLEDFCSRLCAMPDIRKFLVRKLN